MEKNLPFLLKKGKVNFITYIRFQCQRFSKVYWSSLISADLSFASICTMLSFPACLKVAAFLPYEISVHLLESGYYFGSKLILRTKIFLGNDVWTEWKGCKLLMFEHLSAITGSRVCLLAQVKASEAVWNHKTVNYFQECAFCIKRLCGR